MTEQKPLPAEPRNEAVARVMTEAARCTEAVTLNEREYRCLRQRAHPGYHRTTYGGRDARWLTQPPASVDVT